MILLNCGTIRWGRWPSQAPGFPMCGLVTVKGDCCGATSRSCLGVVQRPIAGNLAADQQDEALRIPSFTPQSYYSTLQTRAYKTVARFHSALSHLYCVLRGLAVPVEFDHPHETDPVLGHPSFRSCRVALFSPTTQRWRTTWKLTQRDLQSHIGCRPQQIRVPSRLSMAGLRT